MNTYLYMFILYIDLDIDINIYTYIYIYICVYIYIYIYIYIYTHAYARTHTHTHYIHTQADYHTLPLQAPRETGRRGVQPPATGEAQRARDRAAAAPERCLLPRQGGRCRAGKV